MPGIEKKPSGYLDELILPLMLIAMLCVVAFFVFLIWKSYKEQPRTIEVQSDYYRTYTLDGCEYIVFGCGQEQWGAHKGTCKNKIHTTP